MSAVAATGAFAMHDPAFADVLGDQPRLVPVVETAAHEGPVYAADEDALYYTSVPVRERGIPRVAIERIQLAGTSFPVAPTRISRLVEDANVANGMALARDGRLVVCEQGTFGKAAAIALVDRSTGAREALVDSVDGHALSSPNDVALRRDGTIWFTDPSYGHLQGFRPPPELEDRVYRFDPATGETAPVAAGFDKPNGLAFSPDERTLYVADNGAPHELIAFGVRADGLAGGHRLATGTPEHPDGVKVDADGRIYASSLGGVQVFDPTGRLLGEIQLPGAVNFTFGGPDGDVLFITRDTAVWAAVLNAKGA